MALRSGARQQVTDLPTKRQICADGLAGRVGALVLAPEKLRHAATVLRPGRGSRCRAIGTNMRGNWSRLRCQGLVPVGDSRLCYRA